MKVKRYNKVVWEGSSLLSRLTKSDEAEKKNADTNGKKA